MEKPLPDPKLTKREFLQFSGTSLCMLSLGYIFTFPETSQAQLAKKGLIRTKLSPYFTSLDGGEIQGHHPQPAEAENACDQ